MFHLFRAVIDRIKILLARSAALELDPSGAASRSFSRYTERSSRRRAGGRIIGRGSHRPVPYPRGLILPQPPVTRPDGQAWAGALGCRRYFFALCGRSPQQMTGGA